MGRRAASRPGGPTIFGTRVPIFWIGVHGYERALTPEFGQVFWDFVKEGGYENRQKSGGEPQFYRFSKPKDPAFPAMLELFARTDVGLRDAESGLMPIHIDDEVSSLSAILLDEEYYRLLVENRASAGGGERPPRSLRLIRPRSGGIRGAPIASARLSPRRPR